MKTDFSGKGSALKKYNIDPKSRIADVYILQGDHTTNIYGFRVLDEFGEYLINEQWHSGAAAAQWKHFKIPSGKEIVGAHGSHDGEYIKSFGLILWKPNTEARRIVRGATKLEGGKV